MEASVTLQSFPWFEGTGFDSSWDTFDANVPQPGTVDALLQGTGADVPNKPGKNHTLFHLKAGDISTGSVGVRHEDVNGDGVKDTVMIPGSHFDPVVVPDGVNPLVDQWQLEYVLAEDGTATGDVQPFTGQQFSSELAVLSWNFLMLTTGLGAADSTVNIGVLDRDQPFAMGRCSFRQPQYCSFVSGLAAQARNTNSSVRAGGNGKFGRRDFVWHSAVTSRCATTSATSSASRWTSPRTSRSRTGASSSPGSNDAAHRRQRLDRRPRAMSDDLQPDDLGRPARPSSTS